MSAWWNMHARTFVWLFWTMSLLIFRVIPQRFQKKRSIKSFKMWKLLEIWVKTFVSVGLRVAEYVWLYHHVSFILFDRHFLSSTFHLVFRHPLPTVISNLLYKLQSESHFCGQYAMEGNYSRDNRVSNNRFCHFLHRFLLNKT